MRCILVHLKKHDESGQTLIEYYHYETITVLFYGDLLNPPWLLNATDGPYATY